MSADVLIEGFSLTKSWLQDQLERKLGDRPRVGKVEPLGAGAIGYLSVLRRVHLDWNSDQVELPKSLIIKIPCATAANDAFESSGETAKLTGSFEKASHDLETKFYRLLQDEKQEQLLVPTIYAAEDYDSKQPVIVMEDYRNCFAVDFINGLTEKQLFAVAEQIANLQVFSIKNRQRITVLQAEGLFGDGARNPYLKIQKDMLNEIITMISSQTRSMCQKLMENMPELFSCLKIFMANTIDKDPNWMSKIMHQYYSGELPFVLTHGDLWSAQILWRDENAMAGIVDWQCVHQGSPVEDFLLLLSSSATVEKRRELLQPLLDYYYSKMREQLGASMPFSREYLNEELKHIAPWSCILSILDSTVWMNSNVVKQNGKLCAERVAEVARRCAAFVEDAIKLCGW